MFSLSLRDENYNRLIEIGHLLPDSLLELKFSDGNAHIPILYGVEISTEIYSKFKLDPTIRSIDLEEIIKHKFRNPKNKLVILLLLENNDYGVSNLSYEDILDFFEFGCDFGCTLFMLPFLEHYYSTPNVSYSQIVNENGMEKALKTALAQITNKIVILSNLPTIRNLPNITQRIPSINEEITIEEEIQFTASHFKEAISYPFFKEWCLKSENQDLLERIIKHNDLYLESEDSLLSFIVDLSPRDPKYCYLLSHVHAEHCSADSIKPLEALTNSSLSSHCDYDQVRHILSFFIHRSYLLSNGSYFPPLKTRHANPPHVSDFESEVNELNKQTIYHKNKQYTN